MSKRLSQYSFKGKRLKFGGRLTKGKGWRLTKRASSTMLIGALLETFKVGGETIAIFKVRRPKKSETDV